MYVLIDLWIYDLLMQPIYSLDRSAGPMPTQVSFVCTHAYR